MFFFCYSTSDTIYITQNRPALKYYVLKSFRYAWTHVIDYKSCNFSSLVYITILLVDSKNKIFTAIGDVSR